MCVGSSWGRWLASTGAEMWSQVRVSQWAHLQPARSQPGAPPCPGGSRPNPSDSTRTRSPSQVGILLAYLQSPNNTIAVLVSWNDVFRYYVGRVIGMGAVKCGSSHSRLLCDQCNVWPVWRVTACCTMVSVTQLCSTHHHSCSTPPSSSLFALQHCSIF